METKIKERSKEDSSMLRNKLMVFAVLAAALALPSVAQAQVLGVNYFDNANSTTLPDGTLRITTPHFRIPSNLTGSHGPDQCALIYVLKPDQELAACCGCKLSPNALLKLSVNNNLTTNTLSGIGPAGTIAIVPSLVNGLDTTVVPPAPICDPTIPPLTFVAGTPPLTPFVNAWITHVQDSGAITEDDFDFFDGVGGRTTAASLVVDCGIIVKGNGSGTGVCSCTDRNGQPW
jgi:hypothetical protein